MENVKCLIIGSGPAGYTAAIYTARAGLSPVVYTGLVPGGQLTTTSEIDNFPGYPEGVSGSVMMDDLRRQAERFGTQVHTGEVTYIDTSCRPFHVVVDGSHEISAESVIVATGASARYLGLPSEKKYIGMGVSACAVCDGFFYRDRDVAVVGGGDSACEEALYLATLCRRVYLIVRKSFLRASKVMQARVMENERIEVLFEHVTEEILGDDGGVTGARVRSTAGVERILAIDGFFLGIGHEPRTEIFKGQLRLDDEGYIITRGGTGKDAGSFAAGSTATSVEGIFAAGDVADRVYQQAITAAGAGCRAAFDCERFLSEQ
ncbi:MAG: thioredoxin-disulfide reductase [Alistipes sp.]|jgi:thioredoxin reductase (NADPH)|nr:thioredoxin-disulfide reductase [Alistipes sp.]